MAASRGECRLTDTTLRRRRLDGGKAVLQDGGGLTFALLESGGRRVARAVYRFRLNGGRHDMRLGTWPDRTLAEIRAARDAARELVKAGRDPREVAREAKATTAATLTVRGMFDRWDQLHLSRALKDGGAEVRRYFTLDILPTLGDLPAKDLHRSHVANVVDAVLARGAPRAAVMTLVYLRQMARWGVSRGYLDTDPTAGLRKAEIRVNGPRERVLNDAEIRALAELLPRADLPPWAPPAVWLLLATAARVGELLGARWEDFDLDRSEWTIPAERSKNGRGHVVDLSDFALARLEALAELRQGPWLVAGRNLTPRRPVPAEALAALVGPRQRTDGPLTLPGGRWVPHDLRRTAATLMQSCGVLPAVIEAALNHKPRGMVQVYQRYDHRPERRDAFARLGEHLASLASGEIPRVVAMRRA